jgi:hypothetical protein
MPERLAARAPRAAAIEMRRLAFGLAVFMLSSCAATTPSGPGVLALPGTGKSFDQFRADEQECRGQAYAQIGGKNAEQAASDAASRSALIGTAIGAATGGLFGGAEGAAIGAAFGLAGGAIVGSDAAYATSSSLQRRYDHAFTQCMYGKGHKVPVPAGRYSTPGNAPQSGTRTPPPPPPPGQPPPEAPPDYRPK